MFNKQNTIPNYAAGWLYAVSKGLRKSTIDENDCVNGNQDTKNIDVLYCFFEPIAFNVDSL